MLVAGRLPVVILFAALLSSCASITSTTTYTQTKISSRSDVKIQPTTLEFIANSRLDGLVLQLSLRRQEVCLTSVVTTYRKEAHTRREMAANDSKSLSPLTTLLGGIAFGVAGAIMYVNADQFAAESDPAEPTSPDEYRTGGFVLGGFGAGFLGIALIDAIRLRDDDEVVGNIDAAAEVTRARCQEGPASIAQVQLSVDQTSWQTISTADAAGKVMIDLRQLPEVAFARSELRLRASVDSYELMIGLSSAETATLLARLAAAPETKLAKDRAFKQQLVCEEAFATAAPLTVDSATSDATVVAIAAEWAKARAQCASQWQELHEKAWQKIQAQLAATAGERATRRCTSATEAAVDLLGTRVEENEELGIESLHAAVIEKCKDAPNVERSLATLFAKEKEAQRQLQQNEELDEALTRFEELMTNHDAVGLRALTRNRTLAAVLRGAPDAGPAFLRLARIWILVLEGGGSGPALRAQLCASRALVLAFSGQAAWGNLRAEAVRRNDVVKGAMLAKELGGGSCK